MDAATFLEFARTLRDADSSISCRTAINRAYYAGHHHACKILEAEGVSLPSTGERHELVIYKLRQSSCPELQKAGASLHALRGDRTEADYRLTPGVCETKPVANVAIGRAERLIQQLDQFAAQNSTDRLRYRSKLKSDWPPARS